jgi:hypothetical protein
MFLFAGPHMISFVIQSICGIIKIFVDIFIERVNSLFVDFLRRLCDHFIAQNHKKNKSKKRLYCSVTEKAEPNFSPLKDGRALS